MDQKVVTLIIGLAGITATLISSVLGLYFTAKSRSAPLRETLFKKQLDLISRIMHKLGIIRDLVIIMAGENTTFKDKSRNEIREYIRELCEMENEASALLPTELYIEIKRLSYHLTNLLANYDQSNIIDRKGYTTLSAIAAKVALISRTVIGVDELTIDSLSLFSSKNHYNNLTNIEIEQFQEIAKKVNT